VRFGKEIQEVLRRGDRELSRIYGYAVGTLRRITRLLHIECAAGSHQASEKPTVKENVTSYLLHKLLHNCFPKHSETHQNHFKSPILHNNIRKVGSFRNRQVIGSIPILGSILSIT